MNTKAEIDVLSERRRQLFEEGWDVAHDDQHGDGSMALAAAAYAVHFKHSAGRLWPWDACWWKPRSHRENLVRAGALIIAEIERIDRLADPGDPRTPASQGPPEPKARTP